MTLNQYCAMTAPRIDTSKMFTDCAGNAYMLVAVEDKSQTAYAFRAEQIVSEPDPETWWERFVRWLVGISPPSPHVYYHLTGERAPERDFVLTHNRKPQPE